MRGAQRKQVTPQGQEPRHPVPSHNPDCDVHRFWLNWLDTHRFRAPPSGAFAGSELQAFAIREVWFSVACVRIRVSC
jgi:hypothetical protein